MLTTSWQEGSGMQLRAFLQEGRKMKVISCIIPARDRKDMVLKAIESALAQEGWVPEVVVVDDGSTDGTREAVSACFPEVKLISTAGLGPGLARNEGVRAATGHVLMFLDSDDIWLPLHVRSLIPQDFDRIEKMQVLAAKGRQRWRTVQEWYMNMKMQGLV